MSWSLRSSANAFNLSGSGSNPAATSVNLDRTASNTRLRNGRACTALSTRPVRVTPISKIPSRSADCSCPARQGAAGRSDASHVKRGRPPVRPGAAAANRRATAPRLTATAILSPPRRCGSTPGSSNRGSPGAQWYASLVSATRPPSSLTAIKPCHRTSAPRPRPDSSHCKDGIVC